MLDRAGLDSALAPPPPPPLPPQAVRGVRAALRRMGDTCLVNSIVIQAWEAAHGERRDLVIGTTGPGDFEAHAWLEGDPVVPASEPDEEVARDFSELLRRPAPEYRRAASGQAL